MDISIENIYDIIKTHYYALKYSMSVDKIITKDYINSLLELYNADKVIYCLQTLPDIGIEFKFDYQNDVSCEEDISGDETGGDETGGDENVYNYNDKNETDNVNIVDDDKQEMTINININTNTNTNTNTIETYNKPLKTRICIARDDNEYRTKVKSLFEKCIICQNTGDCNIACCQVAHIWNHSQCDDESKYNIYNGVLMCANTHLLFDKHLLQLKIVDYGMGIVYIHIDSSLQEYQIYKYHGSNITLFKENMEFLEKRYIICY